jgi:hypothetical protein
MSTSSSAAPSTCQAAGTPTTRRAAPRAGAAPGESAGAPAYPGARKSTGTTRPPQSFHFDPVLLNPGSIRESTQWQLHCLVKPREKSRSFSSQLEGVARSHRDRFIILFNPVNKFNCAVVFLASDAVRRRCVLRAQAVPPGSGEVRARGLAQHLAVRGEDADADAGGQPRAEVLQPPAQQRQPGLQAQEHPRHHHALDEPN